MNNIFKNSISSLINQFLYIVSLFFVRCIFVRTLGIEYQGLDSVMTSVVAILSLADLGIGTASVFALYEPLNELQYDKIRSLIALYRKIYAIIILCLLIAGIFMCLFVPMLIKDSIFSEWFIRKIFVLFLLQTASSYVFAEYQSLFLANEKNYINTIYKSIVCVISAILQILAIVLLKSYYLKIIIIILSNLITNYALRCKALSKYPYLKEEDKNCLTKEEKSSLFADFKNLSISRIADVLIFQTDNLFIAKLIGETVVGIYSNYYLIVSGINSIINYVITAVQPTFARKLLKNTSNRETQNEIFNNFSLVALIITSICICGYYVMFSPFVSAWVGHSNLLSKSTVVLIIITQLIFLLDNPFWTMMYLNGAFKQIKNVGFFASVINIITSFFLTKIFGINGVVCGTIICYTISITLHIIYVFTHIITDSKVIVRYIKKLLLFATSTTACIYICNNIFNIITSINIHTILKIFLGVFVCISITLTVNILLFYKDIKELIFYLRKEKYESKL